MKKNIYIGILLSATLFSCSNTSKDDLTVPEIKTLPDNVKLIFDDNCINCHGSVPSGGAQTSYTDYSEVKSNIDLIISYTESGYMPLGGTPLSSQDINILKQWQIDGFPKN